MTSSTAVHVAVPVQRWPSEIPLFILVALVSAGMWLLLTITIIGLAYALVLGAIFFVAHAAFVSYIKGNAVRIGPDQFPGLHEAVQRLSQRVGLQQPPDAYVMESGGALNAFAMRFMRSKIVVLYSDLIDACGDNLAARDMIIAHELGHIRAGHLRFQWVLLPGMMIPFLGTAYSRAREYTCDRYGMAGAGDRDGALHGLTILAAGGALGRLVNRRALARQKNDLNTGWMTIGKWMSTHPPLAERIAALDPALQSEWQGSYAGPLRALGIMVAVPVVVSGLMVGAIFVGTQVLGLPFETVFGRRVAAAAADSPAQTSTEQELEELLRMASAPTGSAASSTDDTAKVDKAEREIQLLANVVAQELRENRALPANWDALVQACQAQQACIGTPNDPFDGAPYGYVATTRYFVMFSSGPDQEPETADDIVYDSRAGQLSRGWGGSSAGSR